MILSQLCNYFAAIEMYHNIGLILLHWLMGFEKTFITPHKEKNFTRYILTQQLLLGLVPKILPQKHDPDGSICH